MSEIIKPGPNMAVYPMDGMIADQVIAWIRGVAAKAALDATNQLYQKYLAEPFHSWWLAYDNSHADEPPPGVPMGFNALMDGMDFALVKSDVPCGPPPTFTKRNVAPSSGQIVGTPTQGLIFGPINGKVTLKDGTVWMRLS